MQHHQLPGVYSQPPPLLPPPQGYYYPSPLPPPLPFGVLQPPPPGAVPPPPVPPSWQAPEDPWLSAFKKRHATHSREEVIRVYRRVAAALERLPHVDDPTDMKELQREVERDLSLLESQRREIEKILRRDRRQAKKRDWRRRRRIERKQALREEEARAERLSWEIDLQRAHFVLDTVAALQAERQKREEEEKERRVRMANQQRERTKTLTQRLEVLRDLRIQRLKKQGNFFPDEDNVWFERLRRRLHEEETAEGTDIHEEVAMDVALPEMPEKDKEDTSDPNPKNPMVDPFFAFFYRAYSSHQALIEIRRIWDSYIVPTGMGGSRIPPTFVAPPSPGDRGWAAYLVDSDEEDSDNEPKDGAHAVPPRG